MANRMSKKSSEEAMDLVLVYGVKKIPVRLETDKGKNLVHLSQTVYDKTRVEPSSQKLICKGRTLFKPEDVNTDFMNKSLSSLGISNGERIMVLGRRGAPPTPPHLTDNKQDTSSSNSGLDEGTSKMVNLPSSIGSNSNESSEIEISENPQDDRLTNPLLDLKDKVDQITAQCDQKIAIISETRNVKELKACKGSLIGFHEDSMKLLEKVDSTPVRDDPDYRKQRKDLVHRLQSILDKCEDSLDNVKSKIASLEPS